MARTVEWGLGFKSFQQQSMVPKMKWCGKVTNEDDVLWVKLSQESIARSLNNGVGCKTRRHWTAAEGLLLESVSRMSSPLLKDITRGLHEGCNYLLFLNEGPSCQPR